MGTSPAPLRRVSAAPSLVLILLFSLLIAAHCQQNSTISPNITYSFPSFNATDRSHLDISSDANINPIQDLIQLTPNTGNNKSYLTHKSGRVLLNRSFKLWDDRPTSNSTTKHVASFTTAFTMEALISDGTTPGEGLAFLIAPATGDLPPGSDGGYLGLTNSSLNGSPANHLIAVEFDTLKESYDPDNNHVGLDINSVVSNTTTSLSRFGIEIAGNTTSYNVWIEYDGAARYIRVYMAATMDNPKRRTLVLNASLDLSEHLLQSSYFGFAGSTGDYYQINNILSWNLTVENLSPDDASGWPAWKLALAIGVPSLAVAVIAGTIISMYMNRRRVKDDPSVLLNLKSLPGMPREFTLKELKKATNNFDDRLRLGQGGFGVVYKGVIPGENTEVAVKKFSRDRMSSRDDFIAELTIINRLRHKHLVRVVGWCHENRVLLLVYDFMPNGSLDQHLYGGPEWPILSWERRYNIIAGLASALHYLHNEYDQKVVHRDLKASNVMLDATFNARLGDFGLARAIDTGKTSYAERNLGGVPGTLGYIAPECFHTGKATRQSDVFGFGAVVLEVACGRRPRGDFEGFRDLSDWVWKLHREGRILEAVDQRLEGDFVATEAERLLLLGLACCYPLPGERPKTQALVQMLSGSVPVPEIPPFKPAFVWPSGPMDDDEDGSSAASALLTSIVVTSTYDASSSGWTPQCLSREGHVGNADISMV